MPQSLIHLPIHIVFSTKNRDPLIDHAIEPSLYAFLGFICNEIKCPPIKINGMPDHVHILANLSRNVTVAKFVEKVKTESSKWMKKQHAQYTQFTWQKGYGGFGVDHETLPRIEQYIISQKEHHKTKTFKEELLAFMRYYKMPYDEKYLWD
ncbi:IS200/IS605 family transposase [Simkania negevensis]|uniref:IS200/IS605 family transposase n=1 Tax=Simkania negevensis TaxID=83561 RepID=A0ABS3APN3_9BACT|nr:IS200/IS605 family transposase [Simkania negevensis]